MKEEYRKEIRKILREIKDERVLMVIYTFVKTHLEMLQEKGGAI